MVSLLLAVVLAGVTSEQQMQQNYADAYEQSVRAAEAADGGGWGPLVSRL